MRTMNDREELFWLLKDGAKEFEELLYSASYTIPEAHACFERLKVRFDDMEWDDATKELKCYKEEKMERKMIFEQKEKYEEMYKLIDDAVANLDKVIAMCDEISRGVNEESINWVNYRAIRDFREDVVYKADGVSLLINFLCEMYEGMDVYGIIDNKTEVQDVYFSDTYGQCVGYLGDNIDEKFENQWGEEQYRYEIGKFKLRWDDDNAALTDIVTNH